MFDMSPYKKPAGTIACTSLAHLLLINSEDRNGGQWSSLFKRMSRCHQKFVLWRVLDCDGRLPDKA